MEQLNYEIELEKVYKQIENNKLAVLATCDNNRPTVRTMSIVFFDEKIYFQTSVDYLKYKQISKNNNIALCILNIQIEGIANLKGKTTENDKFIEIYKKDHKDSYKKYSNLDTSRLIEIIPQKITIWDYDSSGKPSRIFIDLATKNVHRTMEPFIEKAY
jgi:uncharacterized pyridoxamine 5'-phosphate oxidase family protein